MLLGGPQQNSALRMLMLGSARMHTVHVAMCSLSIGIGEYLVIHKPGDKLTAQASFLPCQGPTSHCYLHGESKLAAR